MRLNDRNDWFFVWFDDKKSMIDTMVRNMQADLEAGYNPNGKSIQIQLAMIEEYKTRFDHELMAFVKMTEIEVNRWCYYDMKRRGVIG